MMRGRDFLDVSDYLQQMTGEANARTRIGRAYYAAYLEARTYYVKRLDYDHVESAREHRKVRNLLTSVDEELAVKLSILRGLRNGADYKLHISFATIKLQVDTALDLCSEILERLEALETASSSDSAKSD